MAHTPTIKSHTAALLLALYFATVFNYSFYAALAEASAPGYFFVTLPLIFFCGFFAVFLLLEVPYLHRVLIPLLFVICACILFSQCFLGVMWTKQMLDNVLQTTWSEARDLITPLSAAFVFVFGILPAALYVCTKIQFASLKRELLVRFGLIVLAIAIAGATLGVGFKDYAAFIRNHRFVRHLIVPLNIANVCQAKIKQLTAKPIPFTRIGLDARQHKIGTKPQVVVLIVGETTRAQNWGLNGYERNTTPRLSARTGIINFNDVSSCGTATATSLPCMFSGMGRARFDEDKAAATENVLDVLKHAGIRSIWIDNDLGSKGISQRVDFINATEEVVNDYCDGDTCRDDILFKHLDKTLANIKKDTLIVLHMIGNHGPAYYLRSDMKTKQFFPECHTKDLALCSRPEIVNAYDNAVLAVDRFIDAVIERLEKRPDLETSLLFVSDHGESLGENNIYLHAIPYAFAPDYQKKVPMVLWFGDDKHSDLDLNCLRSNAQKESYSHDHLFSSLLGLFRVTTKTAFYQKKLDIFGQCRKPVP